MTHQVLLYYCFATIADPNGFAEEHRSLCESLALRGRILIAGEGINGTVSGLAADCLAYMNALRSLPGFSDVEFKIDDAEEHAFKKLFVRVRPEIITLGMPLVASPAPYLSPTEFREMMSRDDVVLLDGRNDYESSLGRFEGAICPPVENFRDIPKWVKEHRELFAGKTVLTYCTGGIRCEKLTAWMRDEGFVDVYQLHGGICSYAKDSATLGEGFEGVNVVFDDRVAVPAGDRSSVLTRCRECDALSANYVNCANVECNIRMIQCPSCEEEFLRCCSDECRKAARLRLKGKKLYESVFPPFVHNSKQ